MNQFTEYKSHTSLELFIIVFMSIAIIIPSLVIVLSVYPYVDRSAMNRIGIIDSSIIVGFILLSIVLIRTFIIKPIHRILFVLGKISEKDLTGDPIVIAWKTNKEFTHLINSVNKMLFSLKDIADKSHTLAVSSEQLTASSEENKATSDETAHAIQRIAEAAEQQFSSVQELTHEAEKINTSIISVAEHADALDKTGNKTQQIISEGIVTVKDVSGQMNTIKKSIGDLAELIGHLNQSSTKINEIVDVINDIASQTQLLSLNASIEAAHAGESGKGFAVVAAEIQKLSAQSSASASEISKIVSVIRNYTKQVVESMNTGIATVEDGTVAVKKSKESFNEIMTFMKIASDEIGTVITAIKNISQSVQKSTANYKPIEQLASETSSNTHNVSAATEQQLASMEEIANSSSSLAQIADEMRQLVAGFKMKDANIAID